MGVPFVPCFFQSAQYLDEQGQRELSGFISLYKKHREAIFQCYTFPIGDKPDNQSWSGFQMINEDNPGSNYLLLFREIHNAESQKTIQLKLLAGKKIKITNIETEESRVEKVPESGEIGFKIKEPGSYQFLQYAVIE